MGNLRSVQKAVEFLGYECSIQQDLTGASAVIVPGVGAFAEAMRRLEPVRPRLDEFVSQSRGCVLGICLGYQLMFEESDEHGTTQGLGYLAGRVEYLPKDKGLKVPHVGWSPVEVASPRRLFKEIPNGAEFYFTHSLYTRVSGPPNCVAATADYGTTFAAAVEQDTVMGVQFHPEKSGRVGLRLLQNFCEEVA